MEAAAFTIAAIVAWAIGFPLWAEVTLTVLAVAAIAVEIGGE